MCLGCWQAWGKPAHTSPAIEAAAHLVRALYAEDCSGGLAHIVTDDWNIEDGSIDWCLRHEDAALPKNATAVACLRALRALSEDDRAAVLAWVDEYPAHAEQAQ